jgi:hypothetical protein
MLSRVKIAEQVDLPSDGFAGDGMAMAQATDSHPSQDIQIALSAYSTGKGGPHISAEDVTHKWAGCP